ncbi:MAG: DUF1232 domain-containing protein [Gammaproteobacteria bacterium]|nr:DUF1232 domain-containing protein [Gammaproteobacteria bacterium]MBU0847925.1 DUF1232 domain-containing protein [Gammaproteobacteria bacterium]MBU1268955.1 DUF1232 domain-containing protein [Gammaproteobacteria bacterium]MBU1529711.1 DUF1232 domain-containing protein [Gammaproteobacteria bacterium]MBU1780038.1 DUF1232 domain-containing protein [Gammaproteobacteria bacterium]
MFTRFFPILTKLKALKTHGRMLWHAFRHADTPKWIKGFMLAVVVYLFSPIDLIPDFLVLLGITDDLVVVTAAMWFLGKVIPEKVKNNLPMEQPDNTKTTHNTTAKPPAAVSSSVSKPLGLLLLAVLLIAALGSHPWFQAQFSNIGTFF